MAKAVVLADRYNWISDADGESVATTATKGETIEVSDKELKRGLDLGTLAKAGSKEAKSADAPAAEDRPAEAIRDAEAEANPQPVSGEHPASSRSRGK